MATKTKAKTPSKAPKKNKAPKAKTTPKAKDPACIVAEVMQVACTSATRFRLWKFQRKTANGYESGFLSDDNVGTQADTIAALRAMARHLKKHGDFAASFSASARRDYIPMACASDGRLYLGDETGAWPLSFPVTAVQWRPGNYAAGKKAD